MPKKHRFFLKATNSFYRPIYGNGTYDLPTATKPGKWMKVKGPLQKCHNGFHACHPHQIKCWLGPANLARKLFVVETRGRVIDEDEDKIVTREMRFVKEIIIPEEVKEARSERVRYYFSYFSEKDIIQILRHNKGLVTIHDMPEA